MAVADILAAAAAVKDEFSGTPNGKFVIALADCCQKLAVHCQDLSSALRVLSERVSVLEGVSSVHATHTTSTPPVGGGYVDATPQRERGLLALGACSTPIQSGFSRRAGWGRQVSRTPSQSSLDQSLHEQVVVAPNENVTSNARFLVARPGRAPSRKLHRLKSGQTPIHPTSRRVGRPPKNLQRDPPIPARRPVGRPPKLLASAGPRLRMDGQSVPEGLLFNCSDYQAFDASTAASTTSAILGHIHPVSQITSSEADQAVLSFNNGDVDYTEDIPRNSDMEDVLAHLKRSPAFHQFEEHTVYAMPARGFFPVHEEDHGRVQGATVEDSQRRSATYSKHRGRGGARGKRGRPRKRLGVEGDNDVSVGEQQCNVDSLDEANNANTCTIEKSQRGFSTYRKRRGHSWVRGRPRKWLVPEGANDASVGGQQYNDDSANGEKKSNESKARCIGVLAHGRHRNRGRHRMQQCNEDSANEENKSNKSKARCIGLSVDGRHRNRGRPRKAHENGQLQLVPDDGSSISSVSSKHGEDKANGPKVKHPALFTEHKRGGYKAARGARFKPRSLRVVPNKMKEVSQVSGKHRRIKELVSEAHGKGWSARGRRRGESVGRLARSRLRSDGYSDRSESKVDRRGLSTGRRHKSDELVQSRRRQSSPHIVSNLTNQVRPASRSDSFSQGENDIAGPKLQILLDRVDQPCVRKATCCSKLDEVSSGLLSKCKMNESVSSRTVRKSDVADNGGEFSGSDEDTSEKLDSDIASNSLDGSSVRERLRGKRRVDGQARPWLCSDGFSDAKLTASDVKRGKMGESGRRNKKDELVHNRRKQCSRHVASHQMNKVRPASMSDPVPQGQIDIAGSRLNILLDRVDESLLAKASTSEHHCVKQTYCSKLDEVSSCSLLKRNVDESISRTSMHLSDFADNGDEFTESDEDTGEKLDLDVVINSVGEYIIEEGDVMPTSPQLNGDDLNSQEGITHPSPVSKVITSATDFILSLSSDEIALKHSTKRGRKRKRFSHNTQSRKPRTDASIISHDPPTTVDLSNGCVISDSNNIARGSICATSAATGITHLEPWMLTPADEIQAESIQVLPELVEAYSLEGKVQVVNWPSCNVSASDVDDIHISPVPVQIFKNKTDPVSRPSSFDCGTLTDASGSTSSVQPITDLVPEVIINEKRKDVLIDQDGITVIDDDNVDITDTNLNFLSSQTGDHETENSGVVIDLTEDEDETNGNVGARNKGSETHMHSNDNIVEIPITDEEGDNVGGILHQCHDNVDTFSTSSKSDSQLSAETDIVTLDFSHLTYEADRTIEWSQDIYEVPREHTITTPPSANQTSISNLASRINAELGKAKIPSQVKAQLGKVNIASIINAELGSVATASSMKKSQSQNNEQLRE